LLIGMVEPLKDQEPIASVLVICQLASALLLAWLFECILRRRNSTVVRASPFAAHPKVSMAES
jgi:hypothetical protein